MSPHYRVKLKMLIAHVIPLGWNYRNHPTLTVTSKFARFESIRLAACAEYCKREKVYKNASLIWTYWWRYWRMAATRTTWSSLARSVISCCFCSSRSTMRVLYTFFCSISHTL